MGQYRLKYSMEVLNITITWRKRNKYEKDYTFNLDQSTFKKNYNRSSHKKEINGLVKSFNVLSLSYIMD